MAYLAETAEVYDCDDMTVSFRAAATVWARKLQHRTPVIGICCQPVLMRRRALGGNGCIPYNDVLDAVLLQYVAD